MERIVVIQSREGVSFIAAALDSGLIDDRELAAAVSRQLGLPYVDVTDAEIEAGLLKKFPPEIARQHTILPLQRRGNRLALAMVDPGDMVAIDAARFATDYDVQPVVASREQMLAAIERFYGEPPKKRSRPKRPRRSRRRPSPRPPPPTRRPSSTSSTTSSPTPSTTRPRTSTWKAIPTASASATAWTASSTRSSPRMQSTATPSSAA
jgi:hypothetical protein